MGVSVGTYLDDETDNKIRLARWYALFHRAHRVIYDNELRYDRRSSPGDDLWRNKT